MQRDILLTAKLALQNQLIHAMTYKNVRSVSQILGDYPELKNEKLTPQPWAVNHPEQLLPIEYIIKYTEMQLDICFKFYSHEDCHRFIDSNIHDVYDLVRILDRLPQQERLSVAERNGSKMQMLIHQVLGLLPTQSRLNYARQNSHAILPGTPFALVIEQLPQEDRETCVNENSQMIKGEFDRWNVARYLQASSVFAPRGQHEPDYQSTVNNKM